MRGAVGAVASAAGGAMGRAGRVPAVSVAARGFRHGALEPMDVLHETSRQYLGITTIEELLEARGTKQLLSVDPTDSVQKAIDKMVHHKVGSVMVMQNRHAVGIFTERDVLDKVLRSGTDTKKTKIEDVMTQNVITGSLEMSVRDAMHLLASNRIRHLPIASFSGDAIDEDSRIVDIVSSRDFFYFLLQ